MTDESEIKPRMLGQVSEKQDESHAFVVPTTLRKANDFVAEHHRHNGTKV